MCSGNKSDQVIMRKDTRLRLHNYAHNLLKVYSVKSVQLYTPVATCMYQMCHIPRQDVIESDRIKKKYVCVCGGDDDAIKLSIIMHFLSGRSQTRFKNASEIWNLDLA